MKEVWKYIDGYEKEYMVSNCGRVKSLKRIATRKNGTQYTIKERILKPRKNSRGYLRVVIYKKYYFIHRLVANTFLDNPNNYPVVNHKDLNIENNHVSNLEWCTQKQNLEHAKENGKFEYTEERKRKMEVVYKTHMKSIYAIDIESGEITYYESLRDAGRELGSAGDICVCLKDKKRTYRGKRYYYAHEKQENNTRY